MAATDLERLVLVLEANTSSIDRQLKKFNKQVDGSMARAAGSAKKLDRAIVSNRFQTGNLAAQFQDIGVQLAGGQSPFLIAIQQGTQLTQVLGPAGLRGSLSLLAGGLASLINPVSLATIAFIGLGGTAIQYLTSIFSSTEQTKQALDVQASTIHEIAERWGDALPAVRAYSEELRRQQEAAELSGAVQETINAAFEKANALLPQVKDQLVGLGNQLFQIGGATTGVEGLSSAFYDAELSMAALERKVRDGTATTEDFQAAADALNDLLGNDAVKANTALAKSIISIRDAYLQAAKGAQTLLEQQAEITGLPGKEGRVGRETLDEAQERFDALLKFRRRIDPEAFPEIDFAAPVSSGGSGGGSSSRGSGGAAKKIDNATDATKKFADAQREAQREAQSLGSALGGAMSGFVNALSDGKLEARELLGIAAQLVSQFARMGSGGAGSGGFLSGLFGAFGGLFADGGHLGAGKWGIAGEAGPEFIRGPATITPLGDITPPRVSAAPAASTVINMPVNIDARNADAAGLARVQAELQNLKRSVPKMVDQRVDVRQTRKTRP